MRKFLGLILSVLLLTSCWDIKYDNPVSYTVQQGNHYSDFPVMFKKGNEIFVKVNFDKSCKYDEQLPGLSGWNKLIGLSEKLDPHVNSARWAWRYNNELDIIDLAAYTYIEGIREIEYIMSVPINQWADLYLGYKNSAWFYLTGEGELIGTRVECGEYNKRNFLWHGLYFGGNSVAPHDVTVHYIFGERSGFNINTD